jgi:ribonucleoside-diphosphate reductase alpha chain
MVKDGKIDWEKLQETVSTGIRFLDRIIDVQHYPLSEIERMHKGNRKIGLGVMGWADMLIKLHITYGTEEAVKLASEVMKFIAEISISESSCLANEKGTFPNWEGSLWQKRGIKMRNATTTTIAPTGSISIIACCSSGIEPNFDFRTIQKRADGEYEVLHPLYEEQIKKGDSKIPPWFVKASDVPMEWHIRMQAAFQEHVHNAVSKTINLSNGASKDDVARAFLLAYELGCKGITVYRDGSRKEQVISSVSSSKSLPSVLEGKRICVETSEGKVYINLSFFDGKPQEVFISTPVETKHAEVYESFARIFSVALRYGVPLKKLITQLERANARYGSVVSVPYSLVRAFRLLGLNGGDAKCPDCGGVVVLEEGCLKCHTCGFTKC